MGAPWARQGKGKPRSKNRGERRTLETMNYRELVKILDRELSLYVRLYAASDNGFVTCVTCGSVHFWKKITLGHYISRSHHSTRWNPHNVAPQCVKCNSFNGGEQFKMRNYLVNRYGEKEVLKLEAWADMKKTESASSLREKIIEYRAKVKQLKFEKGL